MSDTRKRLVPILLAAFITTASLSISVAQVSPATPVIWPAVQKQMRPWTRWWWMGSAVDQQNLGLQIDSFAAAGFGGVQIVPIYGAIGYESKYIRYLSPQWMKMLDFTVQRAGAHQMGVDMAVGTGWPIGGPQVTLPLAATRLVVQTYSLGAGQSLPEKIVINDPKQKGLPGVGLSALIAYGARDSAVDITARVAPDGTLNWKPSSGNWTLYAAFTGKTRQQVKRAAPGGEGLTFDHFAKEPITRYLHTYDSVFRNSSHGVRSFFNDSYEVYDANWTPAFFEEFRRRRGYDLKPFLRELTGNDSSSTVARLKSDYRETMSDLMLENFTRTFTSWAHGKNARTTNQAHGSPGNLLDLYAAVDQPETETFGSSYFPIPGLRRDSADVRNVDPDPYMLKFASSAAHAVGSPLASSETFTWLTEHFKTSWSQCKPEVEQVFLAGINHVFYHGTTYSPISVPWPGWLFYASVNFVPANSLWPHLSGLNNYITRCQSVLQTGVPDNEVMIYWPVYDAWNNAAGMDMPFKVHNVDVWLHPTPFYKDIVQLQNKGYSFDFVSDRMVAHSLVNAGSLKVTEAGAVHKILLVPQCRLMPLETLQNIMRLAENGATVLMQQLPEDVPGMNELEKKRSTFKTLLASFHFTDRSGAVKEMRIGKGRIILSPNLQQAFEYAGIHRETISDLGLKFIRRAVENGKYYYIVNHTAKTIDTLVQLQTAAAATVIMDPQTGKYGLANSADVNGATELRLQLQPGEAVIIRTSAATPLVPAWQYARPSGKPVEPDGDWKVHFTKGGPVLPRDTAVNQLQSWTSFSDTSAIAFSGTAEYTATFTLPKTKAADYLLDLGQVDESARVWINGIDVGIMWSIPFKLRVGSYVIPEKNTIKIEVANLMANRIRYMDRKGIKWRNYHEINFVNIDYKEFNAANWKLQPSGLLGPVTLTPLEISTQ